MTNPDTNKTHSFEQFVELYSPSVYSAIGKLTGLTEENDLEIMTISVFADLLKDKEKLFDGLQPPAFLYKTVLQHVFHYLKKNGAEAKILQLQSILLIDPAHYTPILKPAKKATPITFLNRIKEIWKGSAS